MIYGFVNYNAIISLSVNKDNALADMQNPMDQLMEYAKDMVNATGAGKQLTTAYGKWKQAKNTEEKVKAWNMLLEALTKREIKTDEKFQKLQEKTLTPRRYFNHNTKKLNMRLATFPWNIIGSFLWYKPWIFFLLTDKEKEGEGSDVKW